MILGRRETFTQTYFGLRLAMIVLTVMLFASVLIQYIILRCLQSSISAYYYTPARPIFIAVLCAIGTALIIYRGRTTVENMLLDLAGFLAIIVALVPTGFNLSDRGCQPTNR